MVEGTNEMLKGKEPLTRNKRKAYQETKTRSQFHFQNKKWDSSKTSRHADKKKYLKFKKSGVQKKVGSKKRNPFNLKGPKKTKKNKPKKKCTTVQKKTEKPKKQNQQKCPTIKKKDPKKPSNEASRFVSQELLSGNCHLKRPRVSSELGSRKALDSAKQT